MGIGTALAVGSGLSAVGSFLGGQAQASAAEDAAAAQLQATREGIQLQREIYEQNREDLQPYRATGVSALGRLMRGYGFDVDIASPAVADVPGAASGAGRARADAIAAADEAGIERYRSGFLGSPNDPFNDLGGSNIGPIGLMEDPAYEDYINRYLAGEAGEDVTGAGEAVPPGMTITETGEQGEFGTPLIYEPTEFDPSDIVDSPAYQFRLGEGLDALGRYRRAQGLALSGDAVRGATEFGQGLASTEYGAEFARQRGDELNTFNSQVQDRQNRINALLAMSGIGQTATGQQVGQASNFANASTAALQAGAAGQGDYLTQGANARAAGYVGAGNAAQSGINNYLLYNLLGRGGFG